MRTLIHSGKIINENKTFDGLIVIEEDRIAQVICGNDIPEASFDCRIDASGCYILPGVIDDHVHFREPGLTDKADIESETRAAAAGGVTSFFEMPNTNPQTTTLQALEDKFSLARAHSHVNYSFFFGATNNNVNLFGQLDRTRIPGIKLFMGSSTGNMLVDKLGALLEIFKTAATLRLPLMVHCEDTDIISENMRAVKKQYGDDPMIMLHPLIRSAEACYTSSSVAVNLARTYHTRLHIAHITTADELGLLTADKDIRNQQITAEATPGHLFFTQDNYADKGALIKVNPAIKRAEDREALRKAIADGRINIVGTDHAPHLLKQKMGGCIKAASGMPMIQYSLPLMLQLTDDGIISRERMVQLMCHNPALLFGVSHRGFLREGYKADITIVRKTEPWKIDKDSIVSKCGWSPLEGYSFNWKVDTTICNGHIVYADGVVDTSYCGEEIVFE